MIVGVTFFGTPFTSFGTKDANLRPEATLSHHSLSTQRTKDHALTAAEWATIVTLLTNHLVQAALALNHTLLTGFDAFFCSVHGDALQVFWDSRLRPAGAIIMPLRARSDIPIGNHAQSTEMPEPDWQRTICGDETG